MATFTPLTAAAAATAVWTDATAGDFLAAGTPGRILVTCAGRPPSPPPPLGAGLAAALANALTGDAAPSAAAIATAVWTDATAADFTAAGSIGKSLSTGGIAPAPPAATSSPGANAATTVNLTGNLSGSVGSVTGSVGSVTGNVAGSVGSVSAPVTSRSARSWPLPARSTLSPTAPSRSPMRSGRPSRRRRQGAVVGTTYLVRTPSTGTTIRKLHARQSHHAEPPHMSLVVGLLGPCTSATVPAAAMEAPLLAPDPDAGTVLLATVPAPAPAPAPTPNKPPPYEAGGTTGGYLHDRDPHHAPSRPGASPRTPRTARYPIGINLLGPVPVRIPSGIAPT